MGQKPSREAPEPAVADLGFMPVTMAVPSFPGFSSLPATSAIENLRSGMWSFLRANLVFFSVRVMLASAALNLVKTGARRLAKKRGKRWRKAVHFCGVLVPETFFGPVLGITVGVMEMTGVIPRMNDALPAMVNLIRPHRNISLEDASPASLPAAATARLLTAVLQQTGAAAGNVAGPAPPAVALQDIVPGIPADSIAAPVGALVGLPVAPATTDAGE